MGRPTGGVHTAVLEVLSAFPNKVFDVADILCVGNMNLHLYSNVQQAVNYLAHNCEGIERVGRGKYMYFVSSDDMPTPPKVTGRIEQILAAIEAAPNGTLSCADIAEQLGISKSQVSSRLVDLREMGCGITTKTVIYLEGHTYEQEVKRQGEAASTSEGTSTELRREGQWQGNRCWRRFATSFSIIVGC